MCVFFYFILGKGESIWDRFAHNGKIHDNNTADIADDSYHRYKEDVQLLRNLKVMKIIANYCY